MRFLNAKLYVAIVMQLGQSKENHKHGAWIMQIGIASRLKISSFPGSNPGAPTVISIKSTVKCMKYRYFTVKLIRRVAPAGGNRS